MSSAPDLKTILTQHINLGKPNATGFVSVVCRVCNDHAKKGKRAGFKFQGESVGYNCFNCGHTAGYDPGKHDDMPRDMITVLSAFGISEVDWSPVLFRSLEMRGIPTDANDIPTYVDINPKEIQFPHYFYPLTDDKSDDFAQTAIDYLTERQVDWKSRPFQLVKKDTHPHNRLWYGRVIIPFYKDGKLVFFQGRDLTGLQQKKYLSPAVARDNILSSYDEIERYSEEPLYITEGWFDAYHLNGIAIFSNKLTENQIKWLSKTNRQKVIIPDREGDGQILAMQAIALGWSVSTPDIGSCKDVNDAILKYGELYTKKTIVEKTTSTKFESEANIGIYCKHTPRVGANPYKKPH